MAREHVRGLSPDENYIVKPLVKQNLDELKEAMKQSDYIDLSGQQPDPTEFDQSLNLPPEPPEADDVPQESDGGEPTTQPPIPEAAPPPRWSFLLRRFLVQQTRLQ